jgi:drug/metabolite transporter (DMT)-like permease
MAKHYWAMLTFLAAVWGGSFIFMRVLSPALGALLTTSLRVFCAGLALQIWFLIARRKLYWRQYWQHYLITGILGACIPFTLYAYAAHFLPAGYSAIINSLTPLFGAIFAAVWLDLRLTRRKIIALLFGVCGVLIISHHPEHTDYSLTFYFAVTACVCATICYGLNSIYVRKFARKVDPISMAGASQLLAGALWFGFSLFSLPSLDSIQMLGWSKLILNLIGLSLFCSAIAFIFYYRIMQEVGQSQALSVTFLIPLFGVVWGWLFLDEAITLNMLLGCLCILLAVHLIIKKSP